MTTNHQPLARPAHRGRFSLTWRSIRLACFGALAVVALLTVALFEVTESARRSGWTVIPESRSLNLHPEADRWVAVDQHGSVWMNTDASLARLSPDGHWATYPFPYGWSRATALAIDAQGRPWVGSWGGLSQMSPDGAWMTYAPENSGLANSIVSALATDGQGRIWVGSDVERGKPVGLSMLSPDGHWTTYTSENSVLANSIVSALAIDGQGRVWVGQVEQLSVLSPDGHWTTYTAPNSGLANSFMNALAIDGQGQVWVGTGSGLSLRGLDDRWKTYRSSNSALADDFVRAVAADAQGRIWVGTQGGLNVIETDGHWSTYTVSNSGLDMGRDGVRALAIDARGRAWMTTQTALIAYDRGAAMSFDYMPQLLGLRTASELLLVLMVIGSVYVAALGNPATVPMSGISWFGNTLKQPATITRLAGFSLVSSVLSIVTACGFIYNGIGDSGYPWQNPWLQPWIYIYMLLPIVTLAAGLLAWRHIDAKTERWTHNAAIIGTMLGGLLTVLLDGALVSAWVTSLSH